MNASAGVADGVHDATGAVQEQDAAVDDVGDDDVSVRQQIGVVGVGQVSVFAARCIGVSVLPDDPGMRPECDLGDRVRELLVGDQ